MMATSCLSRKAPNSRLIFCLDMDDGEDRDRKAYSADQRADLDAAYILDILSFSLTVW